MEFLIVNGHIETKEEANLSSFLWNDPILIAQKVWFGHGGIPLLQENVADMEKQLKSLGASLPPLFSNSRELFRLCKRLLNKNKFYRSGHLRFQFSIAQNEVNFLVSAENYTGFNFPINEQGVLVNLAASKKYTQQSFNELKCHNQLFWESIRNDLVETPFQNSIILNENKFVCEAIASNLFMLKDGILITPSVESGCYEDVIRKIVLKLASKMHIETLESAGINADFLFDVDEAFLISEASGMNWVLGVEQKRFVRSVSIELHEKINHYLKEKVSN
jgi:branched-subunit amino acid aminotransferase/4-amino-4-deoxychorismate lyase